MVVYEAGRDEPPCRVDDPRACGAMGVDLGLAADRDEPFAAPGI
ncbi:MAG: hypothetical protein Q8Q14_03025 [Gemmatimonadales bacterium]|nr:hypothetical protein [Gemmatimonadales bacterium]